MLVVMSYDSVHLLALDRSRIMLINAKSIFVSMLVLAVASFVIGCGTASDEPGDGGDGEPAVAAVDENAVVTIGDRAELRASTRPSSVFTVDDFIEAGWKKNKEWPLDTLPEATGAYFGFYNRKDIEIRVYPSHDVAMAAGRESAETAIETEKLSGRGAGFSSVTLYGAYVVAGNTVMLCEISVTDCTDLLDQIAQ